MRFNTAVSCFARHKVAAAFVMGVVGIGTGVTVPLDRPLLAQVTPSQGRQPFFGPLPTPAPVERLGPDLLRVGNIRIDTAKKELSVAGFVNEVPVLEFLANTKDGFKNYESALELDTNAINFNVGCILIGLDSSRAVASRFQFDRALPQGDPVEIFVEWTEGNALRRVRAEQLIYSRIAKRALPEGPWVYTGSVFISQSNQYMAETDGTLIGFMHSPSPIIENPNALVGDYGDSIINPDLNLKAGTKIRLIVQALRRPSSQELK